QRRARMAGHFNLGDDGDMTLSGVLHNFTNVRLEIKSAIVRASIIPCGRRARIQVEHDIRAPRAYLSEQGPFFDLNAPAGIVVEMPMEHVQFVHGHGVEELFHLVFVEKMAGAIEHPAAPGEARPILNVDAGSGPWDPSYRRCGINLRGKQL